jgi:site-specific recombinase XerD
MSNNEIATDTPTEITLEAATWQYIQHLQEQNKSSITVNAYTWDLKQVMAFFGTDCLLPRITLTWVGRFLKSPELLENRKGEPRSVRTVEKTIRVFRLFLIWSQRQGWIESLPLPKAVSLGRQQNREDSQRESTDC